MEKEDVVPTYTTSNKKVARLKETLALVGAKVSQLVDIVGPIIEAHAPKALQILSNGEPFVQTYLTLVVGLILLFYGANFVFTFAAFEAFRLYGYQQSKRHVSELWIAIKKAQEALKKDEPVEDYDLDFAKDIMKKASETAHESLETKFTEDTGVTREILAANNLTAESGEIGELTSQAAQELTQKISGKLSENSKATIMTATAKIKRILKVVDPKQVSSSLVGLVSGVLSVLATLTVTFAQAITIGSSLGDTFYGLIEFYIKPYITQVIPRDFQKWMLPMVVYVFKLIGITIAYFFAKWILVVTVCTKGSELVLIGIQNIATGYGKDFTEEQLSIVGQFLFLGSILGVAKQFFIGYSLPGLLWIFLFPFTIIEWTLATFIVAR